MRPLETLMICLYNSITLQSCSRNPQSPLGTGIRTGFFTIFLFPLKPRRTAGALFKLDSAHWTFSSMSCVSQTISAHILSILALLCSHIAKNTKTVKLSIFTVSHYGVKLSIQSTTNDVKCTVTISGLIIENTIIYSKEVVLMLPLYLSMLVCWYKLLAQNNAVTQ